MSRAADAVAHVQKLAAESPDLAKAADDAADAIFQLRSALSSASPET
jgi:hypothetical protein